MVIPRSGDSVDAIFFTKFPCKLDSVMEKQALAYLLTAESLATESGLGFW